MNFPPNFLTFIILSCAVNAFVPPAKCEDRQAVQIGVIAALSGNWASLGEMTMKGLELARREIEEKNLLPQRIELVVQDSDEAVSGAAAISAYRALRAKGINLIIGPTGSPGGAALAPVAALDDVVLISPSVGISSFHLASKHIFNTQGLWDDVTRSIARTAIAAGHTTMAVFSSDHIWENAQGRIFAGEFEKLGGRIVEVQEPPADSTDLRGEALRIARANPRAVFLSNYNQIGSAAQELRNLHYRGAFYAVTLDASRLANARGALEGADFGKLSEGRAEFAQKFRATFAGDPSYPADFAYDALRALAAAIASAPQPIPRLIQPSLLSVSFEGASGRFRFDEQGCVIRAPSLWRIREGKEVAL